MSEAAPPPPPLPTPSSPATAPMTFSCTSCGAQMTYAPGTTAMRCPSCGTEQQIESQLQIVEHSYDAWAAVPPKPVALIGKQVLTCEGCGATTETDEYSDICQFCGGALVVASEPDGLIVPEAVVPFALNRTTANMAYAAWVKSRWFAPNALKAVGSTDAIKGTYVPHWTFDAKTQSDYVGERGEHYYVTETVPVSDGKGGTHMETMEVMRTRWSPASGHVARDFDDVVVPANRRLPIDRLDKMGPWNLTVAKHFDPHYLAGYAALRYDLDPDAGLAVAKTQMQDVITGDCRGDIGGDEQRVTQLSVQYTALMFKLVLLPIWVASYLYAGKRYQVMINANTGEVVGDRPYSKVKIAFAVLGALIVIAAIVAIYLAASSSGGSS